MWKLVASVDELQRAIRDYLGHRMSDVIAMRAKERLVELTALLAQPQPPRDEVYRTFGASRSGFRDALAVWSDNETAMTATSIHLPVSAAFENPSLSLRFLFLIPAPPPPPRAAFRRTAGRFGSCPARTVSR